MGGLVPAVLATASYTSGIPYTASAPASLELFGPHMPPVAGEPQISDEWCV